jgi:membrane-associated phospholipid phosphatase
MKYFYNLFLKYLGPPFWLSLIALILLILLYSFFNLSLPSLNSINSWLIVLSLLFFIAVIFFYQLIFKFKEWSTMADLLKRVGYSTWEFSFKVIPFFILLYIYDSLCNITQLVNNYQFDELLMRIDRLFLSGNDIAKIFEKIITPWLTGLLSFFYSTYFAFYLVNPIIYFFIKEKKAFDVVLTGIIITCYLGLIGYILVPCVGPIIYQNRLFTRDLVMPNGELYQNSNDLLASYLFSRGSFHCFPSLHFGITFVWFFYAWKYLRREKYLKYFYYLHLPVIILLWFSTLYLRWHYLVDWLGGLIVALAGIWLAPKIVNWWDKIIEKKHVRTD